MTNLAKLSKAFLCVAFLLSASMAAFAGPVISNVYVQSSTATTATIVWTTNVAATSQIKYGFSSFTLPYSNNVDPTLVTSHQMTLTVLNASQPYYFAVVSTASGSSTQSSTVEFALCGTGPVPIQGTINKFYGYGTWSMSWNPPTGASASPTVCGVALQTSLSGNLDQNGALSAVVGDSLKVTPGPGTWTVHATDMGNLSPISITEPLSAQTAEISQPLQAAASTAGLAGCIANTNSNTVWPPACLGGVTAGVTSINGVAGAFTFSGAVSCTSTTCTFTGGSIGGSVSTGFYPCATATNTLGNCLIDFGNTTPDALTLQVPLSVFGTNTFAVVLQAIAGANTSDFSLYANQSDWTVYGPITITAISATSPPHPAVIGNMTLTASNFLNVGSTTPLDNARPNTSVSSLIAQFLPYNTSNIPTCPGTSPVETYTVSMVTDATSATGTYTGGGSITAPVFCNGAAWQMVASAGTGTVTDGSGTGTANQLALSTSTAHVIQYSTSIPNGTTATTQTVGDNTTKVATDAFVLANAAGSGTVSNCTTTPSLAYYATNGTTVSCTSAIPNGTTATTQTGGDNSTKVATTAYVDNATISAAHGGTGINSSSSTGVAQVASGTWSISTALANGTTATTQTAGDNSTRLATTAYVDSGLAGKAASNASTTVDGQVCQLGGSCTHTLAAFGAGALANGTTATTQTTGDNTTKVATDAFVLANASSKWSALTNPTANLSLTMGADTTVFTFNAATGSNDLFKWTDTASNTGTGILGHFTTASGSTEIPWQADVNGLGWQIATNGALAGVGSSAQHGITLPAASSLPSPATSSAGIYSDTSAKLQMYENGGSFSEICSVLNAACTNGLALTPKSFSGTGTASFAVGSAAGSGASAACATSYTCDSIGGTVSLSTGTGLGTGTLLTITTGITRLNNPACPIALFSPVDGTSTAQNMYWSTSHTQIVISMMANDMQASTTYTVVYGPCNGN